MNHRPSHPEISETERFPLLTPAGRKFLHALREHPHAPLWHWPNGEQLDAEGLDQVRAYAKLLAAPSSPPTAIEPPAWLADFVTFCLAEVPFYRRRSPPGTLLESIPSCTRDDLAPRAWEFVPDSAGLDRLIVFSSSGTTGHPAKLPSHPATAACGVPLLEHALAPHGVRLPRGIGTTAIAHIAAYPGAYTTAITVSYLDEAGCIRVNLRPEDWRAAGDDRVYLDAWPSTVLLGDPLALDALNRVGLEQPPRAIVSSIASLSDAFAAELDARYGCPVLDLYALTEAGIVAVRTPAGHEVLPPDLYVEVLDDDDQPCPPGVRGEVTLTGGRNPFAPLLRYRTGDFASLAIRNDKRVLVDLEGRRPVLFQAASGRTVHSMEISRRLRAFPLAQYTLHQDASGAFAFRYRGGADAAALREALTEVLDDPLSLDIGRMEADRQRGRKVVQYRSDRS